ncbi:MAG TPA: MmgE/PrpD family protein [Candidatus Dormibacteraeota bacterium]|nr:MmgE/PrpD family protein [Candidatus Dormibacteraeota bacterium]
MKTIPTSSAQALAGWAAAYRPDADDRALARRALIDTLAVAVAGRKEPVARLAAAEEEAIHWTAAAHALDYDDLHLESTAHVSVVCVPAALLAGGGEAAYLAGAGVMARLGAALGWEHYSRGWHATCTAGAPAAAVAAGVALGLDAPGLARAIALALPAAGGVQRAFGTMAKPLQVGFAVAAGLRAARLAAAGAKADPAALDDWLALVGGDPAAIDLSGPAVPGELAIKLFPCCYALQRPLAALAGLATDPETVEAIRVRTPAAALQPLNRHHARTGLEGKFSLEYGLAAALLDHPVNFESFTDRQVQRPEAARLAERVTVEALPGASGLLDGEFEAEVVTGSGVERVSLRLPPGAPGRPPSDAELAAKVADCCGPLAGEVMGLEWPDAGGFLARALA